MKSDLTAYERRENIKSLLVVEKNTTMVQLSHMFNVSVNTIKRDLVFLSSCMPIETKSGNGGGIFLNMEFEKHKQYLSCREKKLLEKLLKTLSDKDKRLMTNILNKFSVPSCK